MLLKQLSQVNEIDDQISKIHDELRSLYQQRSELLDTPAPTDRNLKKSLTTAREAWAEAQYQQLQAVWHPVRIPAYKQLKARLIKTHKVLGAVENNKPEWAGKFSVVLVPPTHVLPLPLTLESRAHQAFITAPDHIDASLPSAKTSRQWQLLLVFNDSEGLYAGSLEMMLDKKERVVAGYDVTALGLHEYAAFSLQLTEPIDTQSWTILPKDRFDGNQIPCVACIDGQFRFVTDEINSVFGDNRFRPAIEVKA